MPLGALTGGLVAHAFGLRAPYPIAGALRGIALLVALPTLIRAMRELVSRATADGRIPDRARWLRG